MICKLRNQSRNFFAGCAVLLGLVLCACSAPPRSDHALHFELESALFNQCGEDILSFYVSDPRLVDARGKSVPLRLDEEHPWQTKRNALLSLQSPCTREEDDFGNRIVQGSIRKGDFEHVEFELGVPFEMNHTNPLRAPAPLNVPTMFWTWQTGYKFLRIDLAGRWAFHIGSTGCHSASAVRPPAEPCRHPNLATIRLPVGTTDETRIRIALDELLRDTNISEAENCLDAYAEKSTCRKLVQRLGLDVDTGYCKDDCSGQVLFKSLGG